MIARLKENVMRALLVLVITWTGLAPEIVTTAQAAPPNRVNVSYVPPRTLRISRFTSN